jgi:hypothetical protein
VKSEPLLRLLLSARRCSCNTNRQRTGDFTPESRPKIKHKNCLKNCKKNKKGVRGTLCASVTCDCESVEDPTVPSKNGFKNRGVGGLALADMLEPTFCSIPHTQMRVWLSLIIC